jgi:hypothetical protein
MILHDHPNRKKSFGYGANIYRSSLARILARRTGLMAFTGST